MQGDPTGVTPPDNASTIAEIDRFVRQSMRARFFVLDLIKSASATKHVRACRRIDHFVRAQIDRVAECLSVCVIVPHEHVTFCHGLPPLYVALRGTLIGRA